MDPASPGAPAPAEPPTRPLEGVPTTHWSRLPDGRVQGDVCPRECRLRSGQRGLCFVRGAGAEGVVLTDWGRASGFCVDPIEKKLLAHFLPGTAVLCFGTAGCNLACDLCRNWDISKTRETARLNDSADPRRIADAALRAGARSVAFAYNDPVTFLEYAAAVARETRVWLEVTTLLIPGENDSPAELDAMTRWLVDNVGPDTPLHFTAFRPEYRMQDTPGTPHETLARARGIALRDGMRHVYVGNVRDPQRQSTDCPRCGERVIGRDGYLPTSWRMTDDGRCAGCRTAIAGVFEARPGNRGRRRLPIRLAGHAGAPLPGPEPAWTTAHGATSASG